MGRISIFDALQHFQRVGSILPRIVVKLLQLVSFMTADVSMSRGDLSRVAAKSSEWNLAVEEEQSRFLSDGRSLKGPGSTIKSGRVSVETAEVNGICGDRTVETSRIGNFETASDATEDDRDSSCESLGAAGCHGLDCSEVLEGDESS